MWKAKFTLEDKNLATGKVLNTHVLTEAGFANEGQANTWLATGARERYGALFWQRCAKIEVVEEDPYVMDQVPPPSFYAGGAYDCSRRSGFSE